jgi:Asp/Glu/hydantoin racemase
MRILLVNPNMSQSMTDEMAMIARNIAMPGVEIVALTARTGFPYIASQAEAQIAGAIALEMIAENAENIDAVIIAAFGDPGLKGARELFDIPVVGMAEAAVMSAAMLGERFSIVTFSPLMTRWYTDCVSGTGLSARFMGVRTPAMQEIDVETVRSELRDDMIALARTAVDEDGADVIILGGAPLAGMATEIEADVPAIIIDPITAAVAQATALVAVAPARMFSKRRGKPVGKTSVGLSPALEKVVAMEVDS